MPRALFPQMAQETFGGPPGGGLALGMLNAGLAIGSLIGGLTGGWIHRIYRQGVAIVVAILLWGLSMALFGTTSVLWLAVLYLAIGGWADLVSAVYRSTILQVTATDEMRGRIQGVFTVVVAGGPRLADLVHGVLADATSTAFTVTAGGIATIVLTVVAALLGRSLWRYDTRHPVPADP
jgi:MFS family permease